MRQAVRKNPLRQSTASGKSVPAPVGGWNAKDSLAEMKETEAVVLNNWFPEGSYVRLRGGHQEYATGLGTGVVETLMAYTGLTQKKFFGCANGAVYDVTVSGAVGAAAVSGLTNNRWYYTNYGNSAGNFLFACNGEDTPLKYDGSSWSTMSLSGIASSADLITVGAFKERLFFIEKDSLSFWYLAVNAISGALTEFDMSSFCTKGGYLIAMGTWSRDAGDGADDYIVFLTSEGEVIVYQGSDPSDANNWALSSIFTIARPLGRRCLFRIGSDLVAVTEEGFIPLSKVLIVGRNVNSVKISDKIEDAVSDATAAYGANFGWQGIFFPSKHMAIFNFPITAGAEQQQFVCNTQNGSWCKFTGLNANCWEVYDEEIYFGGNDGAVYKAETGTDDNGAEISTEALQAYTYFSSRSKVKRVTLVRPVMRSTGNLVVSTNVSVDFNYIPAADPLATNEFAGAEWDEEYWDDPYWGDSFRVSKSWRSCNGYGICAALGVKTSTKYQEIQWLSTDYVYELGGFM